MDGHKVIGCMYVEHDVHRIRTHKGLTWKVERKLGGERRRRRNKKAYFPTWMMHNTTSPHTLTVAHHAFDDEVRERKKEEIWADVFSLL